MLATPAYRPIARRPATYILLSIPCSIVCCSSTLPATPSLEPVPAYAVSNSPFPQRMNKEALYKVRGDLYAGAMKLHEDTLSITAELELLVDEKDSEEIWNLAEGDSVEVGPFRVRPNGNHAIKLTGNYAKRG